MNMPNIGPSLAAFQAASGKTAPPTTDSESNAPRKTVDMRNVSLNEINALIKSGVDGLLDVVPYIPTTLTRKSAAREGRDVKIDYLGQLEGIIEFQKNRQEDTAFLERVLRNVNRIDGMALPAALDEWV